MAIKASNQITLVDITDAYSVMLSNESHTFIGNTAAVATTQATTVQVIAMRGADIIPCSVGSVTCPTGLTVSNNGDSTSPTLTFTASTSLTSGGSVSIPVTVDGVTINKTFSWGIAFKGTPGTSVSITSSEVKYQTSSNGTTPPTGTWSLDVPSVANGQFLWTRTIVNYSGNKSTTSYNVSYKGTNGTSVSVKSTAVTYQAGNSGTEKPTGTWTTTVPSVANGQYLWTKTVVTYTDGKSTESYSVSYKGTNGIDAITMVVTSSNGTIFKNTGVSTTLTAHVYKAGVEVTGNALAALGTIKWYKDGSTTALSTTGATLSISASDVDDKASYEAKLEG